MQNRRVTMVGDEGEARWKKRERETVISLQHGLVLCQPLAALVLTQALKAVGLAAQDGIVALQIVLLEFEFWQERSQSRTTKKMSRSGLHVLLGQEQQGGNKTKRTRNLAS